MDYFFTQIDFHEGDGVEVRCNNKMQVVKGQSLWNASAHKRTNAGPRPEAYGREFESIEMMSMRRSAFISGGASPSSTISGFKGGS